MWGKRSTPKKKMANAYQQAYTEGYDEGSQAGFEQRQQEGYDHGHQNRYNDGYDDGFEDAIANPDEDHDNIGCGDDHICGCACICDFCTGDICTRNEELVPACTYNQEYANTEEMEDRYSEYSG